MLLLVIEENMRAERLQNWCLVTIPHKVCFVGWSAPSSKSMNDSCMRRRISGRNDSYSNLAHAFVIHVDAS